MDKLGVAQSAYDEIKEKGGEIVAISGDSPDDVKAAAAKYGIAFPWLADPDLKAADAYGIRHKDAIPGKDASRPATFFIRADGTPGGAIQPDTYRRIDTREQIIEGFEKAVTSP